MNTKNAWQALSSLVLCISGCGGGPSAQSVPPPSRDICADYGGLSILLAEATVRCTGTIGPKSFAIKGDKGPLLSNFTECVGEGQEKVANYERVQYLLRLQAFRAALPTYQECLTDRYRRWSQLFKQTELETCPNWKQTDSFGEDDKEPASTKQRAKMQPKLPYVPVPGANPEQNKAVAQKGVILVPPIRGGGPPAGTQPGAGQPYVDLQAPSKSSLVYEVYYDKPEPKCEDPAVCAAQCAAFLPGFVVSASGKRLLADPANWYRDWMFDPCPTTSTGTSASTPTANPFCPPYVHAMATTKTSTTSTTPPGDLYGHPNRANKGERCVRWVASDTAGHPGYNYVTDLVLECPSPTSPLTDCLSRCGN